MFLYANLKASPGAKKREFPCRQNYNDISKDKLKEIHSLTLYFFIIFYLKITSK